MALIFTDVVENAVPSIPVKSVALSIGLRLADKMRIAYKLLILTSYLLTSLHPFFHLSYTRFEFNDP